MTEGRPDWSALRAEYARGGLHESDLPADPFTLFDRWLADAVAAGLPEPNAMVVASATPEGHPSARMVLLKGVTDYGFVFFTNLLSRKGGELTANPSCALLFPWHQLERQVRVEGVASQLLREDVAAYFRSRPRGARLGAWASRQSRVVSGREELDAAYADAEGRFGDDDDVPPPQEWGGFVVRPESFEFWQGRPGRMHDRLVYRRLRPPEGGDPAVEATGWTTHRLAP